VKAHYRLCLGAIFLACCAMIFGMTGFGARRTVAAISFYQVHISPHKPAWVRCRYNESCSAYAKRVIAEKGLLKGGADAFLRLSLCY